jgi:hypothetical protein
MSIDINYTPFLDRETIAQEIKNILQSFDTQCKNVTFKKGIYIYGAPGSGKTHFVTRLLRDLNYDVIKYDAGDVRNKSLVDTITSNNVSNRNVLEMMSRRVKKIAIVMDEIDGMNNGDKGGINSLIKLIRQKKTKKQKLENVTLNPIICIGNYYVDKKIKELMKVCNVFELKTPTSDQIDGLIHHTMPTMYTDATLRGRILEYVQGDIRKFSFVHRIAATKPQLLTSDTIHHIFNIKSYNEDAKTITKALINRPANIEQHTVCMNETDRTIVALLWHENIVDALSHLPNERAFPVYSDILDTTCYADYIDRITFQHQIWQFNEMSSLMKTFRNNRMYHETFPEMRDRFHPAEVRFTKVLTKYSTEYNNSVFVYYLCQELDMDRKDLVSFFQELRLHYGADFFNNTDLLNRVISQVFDGYSVTKLDVKRMYRYLDKTVKRDAEVAAIGEDDVCEDEDE